MFNMKKVIYHEFSNLQRSNIVEDLYQQYNWYPVLLSGEDSFSIRAWLKENHSDCFLVDTMRLRQAQFDYSIFDASYSIDLNIINELSRYESSYLSLLGTFQDPTGWVYGYEERKRFYYDILKYWNTVIRNLKPDIIVFYTWPHTPTCYALYLICKHYYKIDVLYIDPLPLFEGHYHFIGCSLEQLYKPFMKAYESDREFELEDDVINYISTVKAKEGKTPEYIQAAYSFNSQKYLFWKELFVLFLKTLINGNGFRVGKIDWKKNKHRYDSLKSRMNQFEYYIFLLSLTKKNKKLKQYYDANISSVDLTEDYIYFAAPYQPEAVTTPNAGAFQDVLLVVDILSQALPDGWVIYYKEHPSTFLPNFRAALKRNADFYNKLTSFPNVKLIPSDENSFNLIDSAIAVSTIGGTVAWEALLRKKPAINFGAAWYQGCKSLFNIETVEDVRCAFDLISSGYLPDQEDVKRYVAVVQDKCTKGLAHDEFYSDVRENKDPKYEMKKIANALYAAYVDLYGKG